MMSEPLWGREFLTWARKKYWGAWDDEDDTTIYKKEELTKKLQKVYGWSERQAVESIDRALREFTRR